jgi:tripartite-type tricarboxylate transporter receptor subunit TctC
MMFDAISTIVTHVRSGKLKALATTGKSRSAVTPEIPTAGEAGLPGYEATIWLGLMAPTGTPRSVLGKLNLEIVKLLNSQEIREYWTRDGAVPMGMGIEQFDKFLRDDIAKWASVVKATGMKVE